MWEMVEIVRKLLLIAMLGYFRAGSTEQLWTGVLVSLFSILLLTYYSPYVDPRVDAVSWASQVATLFTLVGGAALTGSQGSECDCDTFLSIVGVALSVVNVLPLLAIVYLIGSTVTDLYSAQRARTPPPQSAVLSDEGPSGSIADQCRRTNKAPLQISSTAMLKRNVAQKWFALHTGRDEMHSWHNALWHHGSDRAAAAPMHPTTPVADLKLAEQTVTQQVGLTVGNRVAHSKHGQGTVSRANGTTHNHPEFADGTPLCVLIEFDNGQTHSYMQASWYKLRVLPPIGVSGDESAHSKEARGLIARMRVEHPTHGPGMVQSFQGATHGHPMYADGTPLKVKIAFDSGQTHEYKQASWHQLRVIRDNEPVEPPKKTSLVQDQEEESMQGAGLVVGARIEHPKHGLGVVQSFQGATQGHPMYADGTPLKVKIAFDDGQTHEYKTASWHKLIVVEEAAATGSAAPASAAPSSAPSAAPASAPRASATLIGATVHGGATLSGNGSATALLPAKTVSKIVELVRTPLGLGLSVDCGNRVVAIAQGSHAERSGCFAVHDQVISLNGQLLHLKPLFEERLGAIAVGTKVLIEISKPARLSQTSKVVLANAFLRPASASKARLDSVGQEHVLLEGRMSMRIGGSPFHVPSVVKLTAARGSADRREPWTSFSYTSGRGTVAVPCRAISAVRMHPSNAHPSFELEYVGPSEANPQKNGRNKQPGGVCTRLRVWATSQDQYDEWRMALAPLPLTDGSAVDRARAWLENRIIELPESANEVEHTGSNKPCLAKNVTR